MKNRYKSTYIHLEYSFKIFIKNAKNATIELLFLIQVLKKAIFFIPLVIDIKLSIFEYIFMY